MRQVRCDAPLMNAFSHNAMADGSPRPGFLRATSRHHSTQKILTPFYLRPLFLDATLLARFIQAVHFI